MQEKDHASIEGSAPLYQHEVQGRRRSTRGDSIVCHASRKIRHRVLALTNSRDVSGKLSASSRTSAQDLGTERPELRSAARSSW